MLSLSHFKHGIGASLIGKAHLTLSVRPEAIEAMNSRGRIIPFENHTEGERDMSLID
jgi:hypothetical protein